MYVYVNHASDGCGVTNRSKGQNASDGGFHLRLHLQIRCTEEWKSSKSSICGGTHSYKSVRGTLRESC